MPVFNPDRSFALRLASLFFQGRMAAPEEAGDLYGILGRAAARRGLDEPRLFIAAGAAANAFALGDGARGAIFGVTQGLLEVLNPDEFEAVMVFLSARLSLVPLPARLLAVLWTGTICYCAEQLFGFVLFSLGLRSSRMLKRLTHRAHRAVVMPVRSGLAGQSAREYSWVLGQLENPLILLSALKKMEARSVRNLPRNFPVWLSPLWLLVSMAPDDSGFYLAQGPRLEMVLEDLEREARARGH